MEQPTADGSPLDVPIMAAFLGLRGLPWWFALGFNNANPLLQVYPDRLRTRVFRLRERPFDEVEQVEVNRSIGSWALTVHFRGTVWTFAATVRDIEALQPALDVLAARVPLGPGARTVQQTEL